MYNKVYESLTHNDEIIEATNMGVCIELKNNLELQIIFIRSNPSPFQLLLMGSLPLSTLFLPLNTLPFPTHSAT